MASSALSLYFSTIFSSRRICLCVWANSAEVSFSSSSKRDADSALGRISSIYEESVTRRRMLYLSGQRCD